jgi:hypothetical protein
MSLQHIDSERDLTEDEVNRVQKFLEDFKNDVYDLGEIWDPGEEYVWDGLAVGYMIAKGATPQETTYAWAWYDVATGRKTIKGIINRS